MSPFRAGELMAVFIANTLIPQRDAHVTTELKIEVFPKIKK